MAQQNNKAVTIWLFIVAVCIMLIVVFGGYVRLTRSGLSIVEWNPVSGVIPPVGDEAWQIEFDKYKETPEYQKINTNMTIEEYKKIFYVEFIHRIIARIIGLIVALPLFYFWWKKIIPIKESGIYIAIGLLFLFQAFMGWYMVSSGLEDIPSVSHFRLTFHLLMALLLLGITLWAAFSNLFGFPPLQRDALQKLPFALALTLLISLIIQISYGGFMAGLKAGHVSNTYPLMFGRLIPQGLLSTLEPWWKNLFSSTLTVHFIHRWFAMAVLIASGILYWDAKKRPFSQKLQKSIVWMVGLTCLQITLGVITIWFHVPLFWALIHQTTALSLFCVAIFINYEVLHEATA